MRAGLCLLMLIGCGGGGSGDDGDDPDGECPAFTRIVDGTFNRTGTTLTWTLEVEAMPAEFTFDRPEIPNFVLEYGWQVELDLDGDGMKDWEVAAKHFKDDREPVTVAAADMFTVVQVNLWRVEGPAATIAGFADATLTDNTITFTIDEGEEADLANVTDSATYTTFHMAGPSILSDQCTDTLVISN